MKTCVTGFALATVAALLCNGVQAAEPTTDSLATVKQRVAEDKALLVDVREKQEWDAGHVQGAVLLSLSELRNGITAKKLASQLSKDQIIYTHCAVGIRSCSAADILRKYGYDVRPLEPGYEDLIKAGFEKAKQ